LPGAYKCAYPSDTSGAFTFNLSSGNYGRRDALTASRAGLSFGDMAAGSTGLAQTVTVSKPRQ
jgi:hypothetical protein